MGLSTHAVGFRPADEAWDRMLLVWNACRHANVDVPEIVRHFFGDEDPTDKPGMEVEIDDAIRDWSSESAKGFEVDVTKLPDGVRFVRFYNAW